MKQNAPSRVLQAIAREYIPEDVNLLPGILARIEKENRQAVKSRTKLIAAFVLIILAVVVALFGIPGVAKAIGRLFGYIPDVGIVNQGGPIRVLAEPVSLTRDGITVAVNQATLTIDRTLLDFGVSGVPQSAYPKDESTPGCIELPYLRWPDGTKSELNMPLPSSVNEALFVMPCLFHTLSGSTPVNWELPLKFIPAPAELTILPVLEPTPTLPPAATLPPVPTAVGTVSPTIPPQPILLTTDMAIPTGDGFILIGAIRVQDPNLSGYRLRDVLTLRDANGRKVSYIFPRDIEPAGLLGVRAKDAFAIQFQAAGVAFPLTLEFPGVLLSQPDTQSTAEFMFDTGDSPQQGQEWALDQDIELAGHRLHLTSLRVDSRNYYHFTLQVPENIDSVRVEVKGQSSIGHGEGSYSHGQIETRVAFKELPKGKLTFVFSDLVIASETQTWQAQWQPEILSAEWPTATPPAEPVCLNGDTVQQAPTLPAGFTGQALLAETNGESQLVLANLDDSQRQEIPSLRNRGVLSPDGQKVAYPSADGITILDLATRTSTVLGDQTEMDIVWSPDGSLIAYVSSTELYGVYVAPVSGNSTPKKLTNLGYETLVGWSPDGRLVYYAIPGANNDESFVIRGVDISSGATQDILTLNNLARKAPLLKISPDGEWVAYLVNKYNSLYLQAMDGQTPARLLIANPGLGISGIAWEKESHRLGVSLQDPESQNGTVILLNPSSCEAYRIPGLDGELKGLDIP